MVLTFRHQSIAQLEELNLLPNFQVVVVVVQNLVVVKKPEEAAQDPTALMAVRVVVELEMPRVVAVVKTVLPLAALKAANLLAALKAATLLMLLVEMKTNLVAKKSPMTSIMELTQEHLASISASESNFSYISTHILAYRLRFKFD